MSERQFRFSLLFTGDAKQAKAAAGEVRAAVAGVTAEVQAQAPVTDRQVVAAEKAGAAHRKAAKDARDHAAAERAAREEMQRATGTRPAGSPGRSPTAPVPPGATPPSPGPMPQSEKEKLKAEIVPMFAAQQKYQTKLAKIERAELAGAITKDESAAAQARERHGYDRTVETLRRSDAAVTGNTHKIKLQGHELRNLGMQANDTLQTLALGMSPLQVLLQQGPQMIDAVGGMSKAFQLLKQSVTGIRALMAGTAAAVIGGALAWDQYLRSTKAVEVAAAGRGQRIATTPGMLEGAARTGADEAGISVRAGRDLAAQLLSTGQIGAGNIGGIVGISKDLGATMNLQGEAIGAELAKMFSEPGKAAEALYRQNGLIDSAAAQQIQRLEAQNQKFEAQALLLDKLREKLVDAGEASTWIGRLGAGVGQAGGNFWDALGQTVAGMTGTYDPKLEDQIARLEQAIAQTRAAEAGQDGATGFFARRAQAFIASATTELAELEKQRDAMLEKGKAGEASLRGVLALDLAARSPANASALRERAMRDELAAMQAGRDAPDLSDSQRKEIDTAITAQTQALDALLTRQERSNTLDRMDLQIATERNPLRRAELLGLQAMIRAYGQSASASEMLAEAQRVEANALNEVIAASANQSAAMQEEAVARARLNALQATGIVAAADAADWLERELALRPMIAAAAAAEGDDKARLLDEIEKLKAGYEALDDARKREAAGALGRASADRIADLQRETALIGASAAEQQRAAAAAEAEKRIRDAGINPDGADAVQIRKDAAREAEARLARDRRQQSYDLATSRNMDGYDAAARIASTPVERANIEAQKEYARALAEGADADEAAARATQVRARAMADLYGATLDMIRGQDQQLERLRIEASLAGATEAVRAQAMARYEAELYIRQQGIEANSTEAAQIRDYAVKIADAQRETERLADAWDKVRSAAEGSIDGPLDALLKGDFEGALSSLSSEITGLFAELAIKNPLKNGLLGTDYATLGDVGGLKGIAARIFGGGSTAEITASSMGQTVGSMQVNATTVILGGGGAAGLFGGQSMGGTGMGGAANLPGAPLGQGAMQTGWSNPAGMSRQIALSDQEIVDLKKTVATEWVQSAGDAQAQGIIDTILNRRAAGKWGATVTDVVNAPSQFSDINGRPAWQKGRSSVDDIPMSRIDPRTDAMVDQWLRQRASGARSSVGDNLNYANPYYSDATNQGWINGLQGPVLGSGRAVHRHGTTPDLQGWRPGEFGVSLPGQNALPAAQLERFGAMAATATQNLGTLGNGFDVFGNALAQGVSGGGAAGGGGFLNLLMGGFASAIGIPGFASGGTHKGGLRIVGENGPELEYTGPSTILPADLTRSIMSGASPATRMASAPVIQSNLTINPINNSGAQLKVEAQETTNARGERQVDLVMSDMVANAITVPGGRADRAMRSKYGVKRRGIRR